MPIYYRTDAPSMISAFVKR